MKINWRCRVKNKMFWLALIPATLLFVAAVASLFGIELDVTALSEKLLQVVEAAFAVLGIIGVVNDPTTEGLNDSDRAMTYDKPNGGKQ